MVGLVVGGVTALTLFSTSLSAGSVGGSVQQLTVTSPAPDTGAVFFEAGFGGAGVALAGGALGLLLVVSGVVEFGRGRLWNGKKRSATVENVVTSPVGPTRPGKPEVVSLLAPTVVAKDEPMPEPSESVVRHEISHVIRTIDEVALRANVLALDAAVEAAKNGSSGMGFALVADEMRSLAQGTARVARETSDTYEECIRRRDSSVQIYASVGQRLSVMVERARAVHQFVDQITLMNADEITVSADPAGKSRETMTGSQRLRSQAEALERCVQDLQALV
ncbi:MAG TPA: methyl-accepting chemotaxis protein [Candidatus Limnocylindria bacterium]|jgi:hypothetical protein|nr:methyl-accepting chemotaxis protein [Candidatus Limnocylindria bacterium]